MFIGGVLFLIGALLNAFAQNVWMLIVGRMLLGFGIGCANQVICLCISRFTFIQFLLNYVIYLFIFYLFAVGSNICV